MAKESQSIRNFDALIQRIKEETTSARKKIEILFDAKGFFNALQAAQVLQHIAAPSDKVKAIKIMEPRLCRMSCEESRMVIDAVSIHNDKLIVLECIKRALTDCNTKLGKEFILSCFPYEQDKIKALRILATTYTDSILRKRKGLRLEEIYKQTIRQRMTIYLRHYGVQYNVRDVMAAGGHQGYAAVGGLFTQCRPLEPHLYGSVSEQLKRVPGQGEIKIPKTAQPGVVPSVYTGHPSYAYPRDKTYAEVRGYPETEGYPQVTEPTPFYPAGAPPLTQTVTGAPAPTGWPGLEMREPSFLRDAYNGPYGSATGNTAGLSHDSYAYGRTYPNSVLMD